MNTTYNELQLIKDKFLLVYGRDRASDDALMVLLNQYGFKQIEYTLNRVLNENRDDRSRIVNPYQHLKTIIDRMIIRRVRYQNKGDRSFIPVNGIYSPRKYFYRKK